MWQPVDGMEQVAASRRCKEEAWHLQAACRCGSYGLVYVICIEDEARRLTVGAVAHARRPGHKVRDSCSMGEQHSNPHVLEWGECVWSCSPSGALPACALSLSHTLLSG